MLAATLRLPGRLILHAAWVVACLCAGTRPAAAAEAVTFTRDIAPILFAHCASCHRPGEIAPFSLLSYRDARQRMTLIADATRRRVMPPWKADPAPGLFVGDRSLSDQQIALIQQWVAGGGEQGEPTDLPPVPTFASEWQMGTPDLVVSMPEPYTLVPEGPDLFRTFVIPVPTVAARYVRAIEFRPGNPRAVHHANIGFDPTRSSRRLDAADAEPGYVGGMVQDAAHPAGYLLGWTPGQRPRPSPDGMPWRLEAGSDLVVQLHLQPTGRPEPVQVSLAFFFTDTPPVRTPVGLRLGSETIDIPAGERAYAIEDRYTLPVDADLLAIQPHAHNLGRTMTATAVLPDGTERQLITIRDWDFRWQDVYRYTRPIRLPRGSRLSMRFVYDNSSDNPRNPFNPPRRIVWGQNTSDEMGDLWVQLVPVRTEDLGVLAADIGRKTRAEDIAAYTRVLDADPGNPLRYDALGMLYLQDGRAADAVARFRESLRLNPDSAPTRYNIGLALSLLGQYADAVREFEAAVRLDPSHADAHNNLGALLHVSGRFDQAAVHYREAIRLRPENAEAHANLGRLLSAQGRAAEAMPLLERALALQRDSVSALQALAWIRATAADATLRRPGQAVALAERARQLTGGRDASVFDALAAGYAALGDFDNATKALRAGLQLAEAAGLDALAVDMRGRLQLYEQRTPSVR